MRRVREMLKLRLDAGLSLQEVAFRSGIARSTLREMVGRFERSGLAWPLPLDLGDAELEVRLYVMPKDLYEIRTPTSEDENVAHVRVTLQAFLNL